jgi:hypothetical protein
VTAQAAYLATKMCSKHGTQKTHDGHGHWVCMKCRQETQKRHTEQKAARLATEEVAGPYRSEAERIEMWKLSLRTEGQKTIQADNHYGRRV